MRLSRFMVFSCLLWFWSAPTVLAGKDPPPARASSALAAPQPTVSSEPPPTAVSQPTVPVIENPPPTIQPAPQLAPPPVAISGERGPLPTAGPVSQPGQIAQRGESTVRGSTVPGTAVQRSAGDSAGVAGSSRSSGPPSLPSAALPADNGSASSLVDVNASPGSASAPKQLQCKGRSHPSSGPFLESPFNGWTSINSYLDHDSPDYTLDGEIVLANGLRATVSSGQQSEVFPSYWSSDLRQFINYDGHNGYDFGVSYQPLVAAADGTVTFAGWSGSSEYSSYGQMVLIDHHNGYVTLYGHLSSLAVSKGDTVTAGQEIGISGSTGHSSGPHLHFTVYHNCQVTDPYGWTGSGKDPLTSFDGEHASYLWLPGHDPLVLNPPRNWPSYPLGLKVAVPRTVSHRHLSSRYVPPVDRLVLLRLPSAPTSADVSPGVALAHTEGIITGEARSLAPYLRDLKAQGLVDSHQVVAAAAAVWVRGTATSAQLEGLPGVASLSGVQPAEVRAAQAGLAHSVLLQLGSARAPSLWPVGFRSALHPWRPVITAVNGHALVEGFALPGDHVVVSIRRGNQVPGAADGIGDPETGGFVTMLHDQSGKPLVVTPGDTVRVETAGRHASVRVASLTLDARSNHISGKGRPGATIPIVVLASTGQVEWKGIASADSQGRFRVRLPTREVAGSLAVASTSDSAGDQEAASGYVPGLVVDLSAHTVRGWVPRSASSLEVWRHGRQMLARQIHRDPDGSFESTIRTHHRPFPFQPGDVVSVGSHWNHHRVIVPRLKIHMPVASTRASVWGPQGAHLTVYLANGASHVSKHVTAGSSGRVEVSMRRPVSIGDGGSVTMVTGSGDTLVTSVQVRGVIVHEGTSQITGHSVPGDTLSLYVSSRSGRRLGGAIVSADPSSGHFSATLATASGQPVRIESGMQVLVQDSTGSISATVPRLDIAWPHRRGPIHLRTDARDVIVTVVGRGNVRHAQRLTADAAGRLAVSSPRVAAGIRALGASTLPTDGFSFERALRIVPAGKVTSRCHSKRKGMSCSALGRAAKK